MADDNNTQGPSAAQAIAAAMVALGFLALVGIIFWRATETGQNFASIWAATGTIVGVVVGIIPTYFFQRQITLERARSSKLSDQSTAIAAASTTEAVQEAKRLAPNAFS